MGDPAAHPQAQTPLLLQDPNGTQKYVRWDGDREWTRFAGAAYRRTVPASYVEIGAHLMYPVSSAFLTQVRKSHQRRTRSSSATRTARASTAVPGAGRVRDRGLRRDVRRVLRTTSASRPSSTVCDLIPSAPTDPLSPSSTTRWRSSPG